MSNALQIALFAASLAIVVHLLFNYARARALPSNCSSDVSRAHRVAINGIFDDQRVPFRGFKHPGVGREFGIYGTEASLEPRAILE